MKCFFMFIKKNVQNKFLFTHSCCSNMMKKKVIFVLRYREHKPYMNEFDFLRGTKSVSLINTHSEKKTKQCSKNLNAILEV